MGTVVAIVGNVPGASLQARADVPFEPTAWRANTVVGVFHKGWTRIEIKATRERHTITDQRHGGVRPKSVRFFVLEPADEEKELFLVKNLHIAGRFKIVERVNNPKDANERWASSPFSASTRSRQSPEPK